MFRKNNPAIIFAFSVLLATLLGDLRIISGIVLPARAEAAEVDEAVESALALLHSPDEGERLRGAEQLSHFIPSPENRAEDQKALLRFLRECPFEDERSLGLLIQALNRWGTNTGSVLVRAIVAGDESMSFALARALRGRAGSQKSLSQEIADIAVNSRKRQNRQARLCAIETLGILAFQDPVAEAALREAAQDGDQKVRFRALSALRRSGDRSEETRKVFVAALHDPSPLIAGQAKTSLNDFGPVAATPSTEISQSEPSAALVQMTTDIPRVSPSVAPRAVIAENDILGETRGPSASDSETAPEAAREDEPAAEARAALKMPESISPEVSSSSLSAALNSSDSNERAKAAMEVAASGHADLSLIPPLSAGLRDKDSKMRFAAAYALSRIGDSGVLPLEQASDDTDVLVRLNAVQALEAAALINPQVVGFLEKKLQDDPDSTVQIQAAIILLKLNRRNDRAIEKLVFELPNVGSGLQSRILETLRLGEREIVLQKMRVAIEKASGPQTDTIGQLVLFRTLVDLHPDADLTRDLLGKFLHDSDPELRRAAEGAAARLDARQRGANANP